VSHVFSGNRRLNVTVTGNMQALCGKSNCDLILKTKRLVVMRRAAEMKEISKKSWNDQLISLRLGFFPKITVNSLISHEEKMDTWLLFI